VTFLGVRDLEKGVAPGTAYVCSWTYIYIYIYIHIYIHIYKHKYDFSRGNNGVSPEFHGYREEAPAEDTKVCVLHYVLYIPSHDNFFLIDSYTYVVLAGSVLVLR
jgi:hypothetical protein